MTNYLEQTHKYEELNPKRTNSDNNPGNKNGKVIDPKLYEIVTTTGTTAAAAAAAVAVAAAVAAVAAAAA